MTREEVIKDLIEEMTSEVGMFAGKYDAVNGSDKFMYGVATVMGHLAYLVSDEYGYAFEDKFLHNMTESEKKVLTNKKKRVIIKKKEK